MRTINVRELRLAIPTLTRTLQEEHELVLVSNGQPIARILPAQAEQPRLERLDWLRALAPVQGDSTPIVRQERDRRGT